MSELIQCKIEGCSTTAKTEAELFEHLKTAHGFDEKAIARYMDKTQELRGAPEVMRFDQRLHIDGNGVLKESMEDKPMIVTSERNAWLHSHLDALRNEYNERFRNLENGNGEKTKEIVKEVVNGDLLDKLDLGVRSIAREIVKEEMDKKTIAPQVLDRLDKIEKNLDKLYQYIDTLQSLGVQQQNEITSFKIQQQKDSEPVLFKTHLRDFAPKKGEQNQTQ